MTSKRFFLLSSTGQSQNFTGHLHYFDQSATNQLANVFLIVGVWVSVDFDSKYKILWGETRAHGVPILFMKKKKVRNNNLHNCSNIYTPNSIRMKYVGVEGVCFLADCLRRTQKWPIVGSSFGWLNYLWTSMFLYCH